MKEINEAKADLKSPRGGNQHQKFCEICKMNKLI